MNKSKQLHINLTLLSKGSLLEITSSQFLFVFTHSVSLLIDIFGLFNT